MYYSLKKYKESLIDFSLVKFLIGRQNLEEFGATPIGFYYKGKCLSKLSQESSSETINEIIICFEQVVLLDPSSLLASKSLYRIVRIRVKQKNFYDAFFVAQRYIQLKSEDLKKMNTYLKFIEGVLLIRLFL